MSENPVRVTVELAELNRLQERDNFLSCLEACGVDNWEGFDDAVDMYREQETTMRKLKYNFYKFVLELIKPLAYVCIAEMEKYGY